MCHQPCISHTRCARICDVDRRHHLKVPMMLYLGPILLSSSVASAPLLPPTTRSHRHSGARLRINGCSVQTQCTVASEAATTRCCTAGASTYDDSICTSPLHGSYTKPTTGSFDGRRAVTLCEISRECEALGTRVCTASELQDSGCCGTGLSHDGRFVWSSPSCNLPPSSLWQPPSPPLPPNSPSPLPPPASMTLTCWQASGLPDFEPLGARFRVLQVISIDSKSSFSPFALSSDVAYKVFGFFLDLSSGRATSFYSIAEDVGARVVSNNCAQGVTEYTGTYILQDGRTFSYEATYSQGSRASGWHTSWHFLCEQLKVIFEASLHQPSPAPPAPPSSPSSPEPLFFPSSPPSLTPSPPNNLKQVIAMTTLGCASPCLARALTMVRALVVSCDLVLVGFPTPCNSAV